MLVQIISDVHLETNGLDILHTFKPVADYLILAGDIGNPTDDNYDILLKFVSENWKHIFYVTGNHEYYDSTGIMNKQKLDGLIETLIDNYSNIYWLNNSSIIINNVKFIGSTLWSSPLNVNGLNDFYKNIYDEDVPVTLETFCQWNQNCIQYLTSELDSNSPDDIKYNSTCVITHFLPLQNKDIPNTKYANDEVLDSYFGNKLYHLMPKTDVWVSGHTHQKFNLEILGTKWICNPVGHRNEKIEYTNETIDI